MHIYIGDGECTPEGTYRQTRSEGGTWKTHFLTYISSSRTLPSCSMMRYHLPRNTWPCTSVVQHCVPTISSSLLVFRHPLLGLWVDSQTKNQSLRSSFKPTSPVWTNTLTPPHTVNSDIERHSEPLPHHPRHQKAWVWARDSSCHLHVSSVLSCTVDGCIWKTVITVVHAFISPKSGF